MSKITNKADGPRGFNVHDAKANATQVVLNPGETAEHDLSFSAHPVLEGMIRAGEIEVDGKSGDDAADAFAKKAKPAPKVD